MKKENDVWVAVCSDMKNLLGRGPEGQATLSHRFLSLSGGSHAVVIVAAVSDISQVISYS